MKLVSINVEINKHHETVEVFLEKEKPDVICIQEATPRYISYFKDRGFNTTYEMTCYTHDKEVGVLIATKLPLNSEAFYYYKHDGNVLDEYDETLERRSHHQALVIADILFNEETYKIATTHFTWTPEGDTPNKAQKEDIVNLLKYTYTLSPHILCGDMNIPRNFNSLYEEFLKTYKDNIPTNYKSSLDKNLHKLGENPEKANLFSDYMVDYVFSQEPYVVSGVRLEFGVSDHAAVVATIDKQEIAKVARTARP